MVTPILVLIAALACGRCLILQRRVADLERDTFSAAALSVLLRRTRRILGREDLLAKVHREARRWLPWQHPLLQWLATRQNQHAAVLLDIEEYTNGHRQDELEVQDPPNGGGNGG